MVEVWIYIYYICSNIDNNVKEGDIDYNYLIKTPTIKKIIILDKYIKYNQLIINIFIFSYEKFFSVYLKYNYRKFYNTNRIKDAKL